MRLIGIAGLKTSGKDTTYKAIAKALPDHNVSRVAFADKLKELSAIALGFDGPSETLLRRMDEAKGYWDLAIKERNNQFALPFHLLTGRAYLQNIGQGARRVFHNNFWIDQILPSPYVSDGHITKIDPSVLLWKYPRVDVLCVTDVRYPNEADRVHALGGEIWNVIRPGTESDGHSSEIPLDDDKIDVTIRNFGTLDDLYKIVATSVICSL